MDKSGPIIKAILTEQGVHCKDVVIVPDEEGQIRGTVEKLCSSGTVDLVITTGGTGFGVRDRTPEVRRHLDLFLCISD